MICAWGRLGEWFGAQRYDYQPDIITTAKGLTSAYAPMGAVIASDRVIEPFLQGTRRSSHGFTFGGHPICCAVALANIDAFEDEGILENVRANEAVFRGDARRRCATSRSSATCAAPATSTRIELVKDQETKQSFTDEESETLLRGFLSAELFRRGLICRADDRGDPVVQLSPPLISGPEQFAEIESRPAPGADRGGRTDARREEPRCSPSVS